MSTLVGLGTLDGPPSLSLPLRWDSAYYPSDSMSVLLSHDDIILPNNVAWSPSPGALFGALPVELVASIPYDHALPGINGRAAYRDQSTGNGYVLITFTRDATTQLETYLVALVPLILGLILLHLLFAEQRLNEEAPHSFLIGLAAAMLTVVPLRAALVPAEVQGLTRIDLILGFELLLLTTIGSLRYYLYFHDP